MDRPKIARPSDAQRFPFIPLPKAIERVRELYKIASNYAVPVPAAVKAWGYAEKSSGGMMTIAALKMFGLLTDSGSAQGRKVQLTDSATRIVRDPRPVSPERNALLRDIALTPPIHKNVHDRYRGLPPSDELFRAFLLLDLGMREDAADDFVREFNATMSYAGIVGSDIIQEMEGQVNQEPTDMETGPASTARAMQSSSARMRWENGRDAISDPGAGTPKVSLTPAELNDIKVMLDGNRLRISAWVDAKGLRRLQKIIAANLLLIEDVEDPDDTAPDESGDSET